MDNTRVVRWFVAIFKGAWAEVIDQDTPLTSVLDDSRQWATELLREQANPYAGAHLLRQQTLLGLAASPDKLVTHFKVANGSTEITIHETMQDFIVTHTGSTDAKSTAVEVGDLLLQARSELVPMLSDKAGRIVQGLLDEFSTQAVNVELDTGFASLVSSSGASLESIMNWYDRVNLVWFEAKLYFCFYKTYPGTAAGAFRTGLNWYPQELRINTGTERY